MEYPIADQMPPWMIQSFFDDLGYVKTFLLQGELVKRASHNCFARVKTSLAEGEDK